MKRSFATIFICVTSLTLIFMLNVYIEFAQQKLLKKQTNIEFSEISTFYDSSGSLRIDQVSQAKFEPSLSYVARGYLTGTLWYRLHIKQSGGPNAELALLQISIPNIDHVVLHYQNNQGQWVSLRSGDTVPLSQRPLASPRLGFPVPMMEFESKPFYLSIKNSGSLAIALNVGEWRSMQLAQSLYHIGALLFFIALGAAIFATLFLYVLYADKLFLFFFINQVSYFFAALSYTGYLSALFPSLVTDPITSTWLPIATVMTVAFQTYFFKKLKVNTWISLLQTGILLAYLALLFGQFFIELRFVLMANWLLGALFTITLLIGAWLLKGQNYLSNRDIRIIYTIFATMSFIWLLPVTGLMPATKLAYFGPAIHGLLDVSLILSMTLKVVQSERAKLENVLTEVQQLEIDTQIHRKASRIYRDMLLTITHEIGTGLSVFAFALSKPELTPENHKRMRRALTSLEELLAAFRSSEHIEGSDFTLRPTRVDLADVIKSETKSITDRMEDVHFRLYGIEDQNTVALTDETSVQIVISNLLTNAAKYCDQNSTIDVYLKQQGQTFIFQVENSCLKRALPDATRVFDRFYRGPRVLNRSGSGLGLYLCQKLVLKLGGECSFEIRDERTVTVTVLLPTELADPASVSPDTYPQ